MPTASPPRQPDHPLAWFDTVQGRRVLAEELRLLLLQLKPAHGQQLCVVMPTAKDDEVSPLSQIPGMAETRLWCREDGAWHAENSASSGATQPTPHSIDVLIAAHSVAVLPEPQARLETTARLLARDGAAYFIEFNPWALQQHHWRGHGLGALSLPQLCRLAGRCGLQVRARHALHLRFRETPGGSLLCHTCLPAWLPFCAYVVQVQKSGPGTIFIGEAAPRGMLGAAGGAS